MEPEPANFTFIMSYIGKNIINNVFANTFLFLHPAKRQFENLGLNGPHPSMHTLLPIRFLFWKNSKFSIEPTF
jgi:hypothetical protein